MSAAATVFVVDDEVELRKALTRLLQTEGYRVVACASAEEFLQLPPATGACCLVLDITMPGMGGLGLQQYLARTGSTVPIIFLTGRSDTAMRARAIEDGAADFLTKPVDASQLLPAVRAALQKSATQGVADAELAELRERFAQLTPRERQVLRQVLTGKLNKQIAADLGISLHTIKVHRGRMMVKLGIQAVADLVRAARKVGETPEAS
jgi:FixJ family two-component response regulator